MIVVDANVIVYLLIKGEKTSLAQRTLQKDPDWHVPMLWQHEMLNILATFVRSGGGTLADVQSIWRSSLQLMTARLHDIELEQALTLASIQAVSAYDAQYLILARTLGVALVSEDQRLQRAFSTEVLSMQQFCR